MPGLVRNHRFVQIEIDRRGVGNDRSQRIIDLLLHAELHKPVRSRFIGVAVGQQDVVEKTLTGILSGGHILLIGAPGLAKTLLVENRYAHQLQPDGTLLIENNYKASRKK